MYFQLFSKIYPWYETAVKGRKNHTYRRFLEDSQWWTRERLLKYQWDELQKLLQHASEQAPYWQEVFAGLGLKPEDIKSYADFQKLPLITKEDIRNNKKAMIARNFIGKTWTKATGGSTGMPLELDYTPESYDWRVAASKRGYAWAGCEDGRKQAYIWGVGIGRASLCKRIKEDLHHRVLRQRYFNCFAFDEAKMSDALKEMNHFKSEYIVGYTNPLYNFARFVSRNGKLEFSPKGVISAAEKLHSFQRKEIETVFGCPIFDTYGSREFMLIASECPEHKGLHINMENLFVEIIKDDGTPARPGETGDIVVTDLHNYGMPFIRYKIGDMGVASQGKCPCGRGLSLLDEVVGRSLDMIRTHDGKSIPGEFFPHLMKEFSEVKQFQVIQEDLERLTLNIVKARELSNERLGFMRSEISKVLGNSISLNVNFMADIPLTKTGKFRVTISKLDGIASAPAAHRNDEAAARASQ